jgi:hypothetical protein
MCARSPSENNFSRYRIGVINDFRDSFSFIEWKSYGDGKMQHWDACTVKGEHRGYQESTDAIHVFLNFKKVGEFKDTASAEALLRKLLREAPVDLSEFESYLVPIV